MIITFWKGVFVADHQPGNDVRLLTKAGFRPHEPTLCQVPAECRGCRAHIGRRYYTSRIEHATRLRKFCNQRALAVMKVHLSKLAMSRATDADIKIPVPQGLAYKPYQRAGVAYAITRKDTLFGDDMGLGKTVEALGFLNYVRPQSVLIVSPATLALNWKAEAEKWLVDRYRIFLPKTGEDSAPEQQPGVRLIVITNYEKVVGISRGGEHRDTPLSASLKRQWDVGIFDEAQALKNPEALRTQAVLSEGGLYEHSKRGLFLTGTPMENRPIEIWPIAASICPARFGDWWDFARRYCALHQEERGRKAERIEMPDGSFKIEERKRKVWVADGASNHSELQQRLRTSFMIRRLKTDVLKELPPKRRQLILLPDDQIDWGRYPEFLHWKESYQAQFDDAMARLESSRTMTEYRRAVKDLEKITVPFTETSDVRHKSALLKLPACLKLSDELLASGGIESLVIFGHHRDVLEQIHNHYGDRSCVIYGDTPVKDRVPIVNSFQAGNFDIITAGLKAAGVGLTMTRANTLIFFESDWNPATMRQAEDRLCRIGQTKMVHALYPVLNHSLDCNMLKMTVAKQNVIDRMLDEVPEEMRLRGGMQTKVYQEESSLG